MENNAEFTGLTAWLIRRILPDALERRNHFQAHIASIVRETAEWQARDHGPENPFGPHFSDLSGWDGTLHLMLVHKDHRHDPVLSITRPWSLIFLGDNAEFRARISAACASAETGMSRLQRWLWRLVLDHRSSRVWESHAERYSSHQILSLHLKKNAEAQKPA